MTFAMWTWTIKMCTKMSRRNRITTHESAGEMIRITTDEQSEERAICGSGFHNFFHLSLHSLLLSFPKLSTPTVHQNERYTLRILKAQCRSHIVRYNMRMTANGTLGKSLYVARKHALTNVLLALCFTNFNGAAMTVLGANSSPGAK